MFKRVDLDEAAVEGFSYNNKNNDEERVFINKDHAIVEIQEGDGAALNKIYFQDIPVLIKALQQANDYILRNS